HDDVQCDKEGFEIEFHGPVSFGERWDMAVDSRRNLPLLSSAQGSICIKRLGIESHTSDRCPLSFGPELGLQHLLWRPWARLGEGRARFLGRIKGHKPGMGITLRDDRWHGGAKTRVVVEQPGEPPPLLPDCQPPAPTRVGECGTIAPR